NNHRQQIQIDHRTGCVEIVRPLDREAQSSINLTAIASDGHSNATAILIVRVLDENDNYPIFDKKTARNIRIMENTAIDTVVYTFEATDLDSPPNSYVQYELIARNNDTALLPFVIGQIDGQLKITSLIDREQNDHYDLIIRATDYGGRFTDHHCRVDVDDLIDNSPAFRHRSYELHVYENVTCGQAIFQLDAQDADPTDEINYKIIAGDPFGSFQIEDDQIIVAMGLNFEEIDEYNLKVNAIDRAGNIDTANIRINILNVLDEKPMFAETQYEVNWFEHQTGIVGRFAAMASNAKHSNDNKKRPHLRSLSLNHINYLLMNNYYDSFQLNSSNAILSIIRPIDRERLQQEQRSNIIELKLMAIDSLSRLSNMAKIAIKIVDINDNVPEFISPCERQVFHLQENHHYDSNSSIGWIKAEDQDEADIIEYRLIPTYNDRFSIDSTGVIRLRSSTMFDREQQDQFPMQVTVSDSKHSISTNISIIIDDQNDCSPQITRINGIPVLNTDTMLKLRIPMKKLRSIFEHNFPLIGLQVFDCDEGMNGRVQVRIDDDSLYNVFHVDDQTGVIKTDGRNLNEEMLMQINQIDLILTDQSDTNQLVTEYSIEFDWTDEDDRYRESELIGKNFIELFISESNVVNESVYRFETDIDSISIEIYAGDMYNHFAIVNRSLINVRPLDYETIKSYDLFLQANNHVHQYQLIFIRLNVVNENDNPPTFIQSVYNVSIPEEEADIFVQQVWANDCDSPDTRIKYSIIENKLPFKIDSNTGHIFTTEKIDRELIDHFKLTITATDDVGLQSTATVMVTIEDKNDNPPRFTHLLRTNISEQTAVESFIIQVQSVDKDLDNNSRVTYNLLTERQTFRIDSTNGKIYLIDRLDRETREEYFLTVSADDGSWKSQTTVTIYVLDENDCHPEFEQPAYEFNVAFDQFTVNRTIAKVRAIDRDKTYNGMVTYRLKERSKHFVINAKTGEIVVRKIPKLYEQEMSFLNRHTLTVIATDSGRLPNSNQVTVLIRSYSNVYERNDDMIEIPVDLRNGTLLHTSNAMIRLVDDPNAQIVRAHYNQILFNGESNVQINNVYSIQIDNNYEIF
ncbi:hypothetical protein BLA29_001533, partial [Euroglyphus maynei]